MKVALNEPPRVFTTGRGEEIRISDCGRLSLAPNEQITFVTDGRGEWDVTRKDWGFYATPSLNGRLITYGLRAVVAKSYAGKYYLFLVEKGREDAFKQYVASERNTVVRWLDNDEDLSTIEAPEAKVEATPGGARVHCMCGADRLVTVHTYFAPPEGEVRFAITSGTQYRREIFRCAACGHYLSLHSMNDAAFYRGAYVDSTYGDEVGLRKAFERILALPTERSDNAGRVLRIADFAAMHFGPEKRPSVLDVGSGLCVFLHAMKGEGWRCTALDPDPRAARHARDVVGVEAICADFIATNGLVTHDVVTFNKVLEHVVDPIGMLRSAHGIVHEAGFVYVELPDGEGALGDPAGVGREEFFVEHIHIFGAASAALLAGRAGFSLLSLERVREPSGKYTLRAFLSPRSPLCPR